MPLPTRVAAGLVLLYGQPVHRVSATRIGQVAITDNGVTIRFGRDDLDVPEPFATLITVLYGSRANLQTAAHHDCPWLFPGYAPGQHINANHLSDELRQHGAPPLASRAGAWQQLVREIPPSVLADALGISPVTAMKHAELAGADYLRHAYPVSSPGGPAERNSGRVRSKAFCSRMKGSQMCTEWIGPLPGQDETPHAHWHTAELTG